MLEHDGACSPTSRNIYGFGANIPSNEIMLEHDGGLSPSSRSIWGFGTNIPSNIQKSEKRICEFEHLRLLNQ